VDDNSMYSVIKVVFVLTIKRLCNFKHLFLQFR